MTTAADDSAVEDAFERLLVGRPVPEGAAGLTAFTEAVRASATRPGRPHAALAELLATGLLTDQSSPSARTARSAGAPPSRRDARIRNRRRFAMFFPALFAKLLSAGAIAQAASGAGIALVAVTGAGAVGVLPGPLQNTVASAVETVTPLDLPGGHEAAPVHEPTTGNPATGDPATGTQPVGAPVDGGAGAGALLGAPAKDVVTAWMKQPIEGTFGAWVTQARHDPGLLAAIKASGHPFGYWVSERAHQKGLTGDDLAKAGVDLDEPTTVPAAAPKVATATHEPAPKSASASGGTSGKAHAASTSPAGRNGKDDADAGAATRHAEGHAEGNERD